MVEMIVALLVTAIFVLGVIEATRLLAVRKQTAGAQDMRNVILGSLRQTASNPRTLWKSLHPSAANLALGQNAQFITCVCGGGVCQNDSSAPVSILDPNDPSGNTVLIPAFFNDSGLNCAGTEPNCFFQATASFIAQCPPAVAMPTAMPNPALTCATPSEFVELVITLQQNPATVAASGAMIKKSTATSYVLTKNIVASPPTGTCP